jgi:hypothetical protein
MQSVPVDFASPGIGLARDIGLAQDAAKPKL